MMHRQLARALASTTDERCKDAGMALVLILLIVWFATRNDIYISAAIAFHIVNMVAPKLFKPFAVVWFALSHAVGAVVARIVLGLVFFLVVTPVGWWRRAVGHDPLLLKQFRAGTESVMKVRQHTYTPQDLETPY